MTNHANKHKVTQISMRKASCGFDWFEWQKVEGLIKKNCAGSSLTITAYDQNKDEQTQKQDETLRHSALCIAQCLDEALSNLIQ